MNSIKGFSKLPGLANNADGQTAQFGELSYLSGTYSRHQTNHVLPSLYPGVELVVFSAKNDSNTMFSPSTGVIQHILSIMGWVYDQHNASAIPSNINKSAFISSLTVEFPSMTNVEINEILNGTPSTKRMPDYIKWRYNDGGLIIENKIWFCDERFQAQYDEYEILIVPPVDNINTLNASSASVGLQIAAVSPSEMLQDMNVLMDAFPTRVIAHPLTWTDPNNPGATITTYWYLALYGPSAADVDNIKNEIREYIGLHSSLSVWPTIYPSLYSDNEYVIIPLWEDLALEATGLDPALFRTLVKVGKLKSVATAMIPQTYAQSVNISTYLNSYLFVGSAYYRSMCILGVGNPNNVGGDFDLQAKYSDYMVVAPSSGDFARMSANTQAFVNALNAALDKAKDLTATSAVPVGYTRAVRNGRVFLAFVLSGFTYLVLSQLSYSE